MKNLLVILCPFIILFSCGNNRTQQILFVIPQAMTRGEFILKGNDSEIYKVAQSIESKKNPSPTLVGYLSYAYFIMNDFKKSLSLAENSIKSGNTDPRISNLAGILYLEKKDSENAERYFLKSLQNNSSNLVAMYNYAQICYSKREYKKAKDYINTILSENNNYFNANFLLGKIAIEENDIENAKKYFINEIKLYPNSSAPYFELGSILKNENANIDLIIHFYYKALSGSPFDQKIRIALINEYNIKKGESAEVAKKETQLLKLSQTDPSLFNYANALINSGENKQNQADAVSILEELLKRYPGFPDANTLIGSLYFKLKNENLGYAYLQKELTVNPNCLKAQYDIAVYLWKKGIETKSTDSVNAAKEFLRKCLIIDPMDEDSALCLKQINETQKNEYLPHERKINKYRGHII